MTNQVKRELTFREQEILLLIGRSFNSRSIAVMLGIAYFTVRKHRSNILVKLDLHGAGRIACYAAVAAGGAPDSNFAQHGPP
ncbi:response regulator transcription factor [Massilia rubra]|uniref:Helix-turn-helix transcriptional regulator n=1 Tax=Massilia rubra TaxID=2607910 RepID=A0ABX0LRY0_9BURK|nr:helix-turn-helix transcriptional regulator [Massilia rubra]NHZ32901.1 helix-turn-helix transcriptional regulator [Massilia rubra]